MSCDRFGNHCDNGTRVGVGIEIGVPVGQPGYRQPEDQVRREAFHVAEELRRGMTGQALQDIRNDVYSMRPHEAERFNFALADACRQMGVRDPLREAPEIRRDPYSGRPFQTGNDVLLLTDPYRRTEDVVKLIPHDRPMGPGPGGYTEIPPVVPIVPVQPRVGIDIHLGRRW